MWFFYAWRREKRGTTKNPRRSEINIGHQHYRWLKIRPIVQRGAYTKISGAEPLFEFIAQDSSSRGCGWYTMGKSVRASGLLLRRRLQFIHHVSLTLPTDLTKYYASFFARDIPCLFFYATKMHTIKKKCICSRKDAIIDIEIDILLLKWFTEKKSSRNAERDK